MDKKKTTDPQEDGSDPFTLIDGEARWDRASLTDFIDRMNRVAFQRSLNRRLVAPSNQESLSD